MQYLKKMIDLPPAWLALFAALAWMQAVYLPIGGFGAWGNRAGLVLILLGLILMAVSILTMVAGRTTVIPHRDPDALITGGVFRFTRNPIYLADTAILTGLILRWDAVLSLLLIPVFVGVIQSRFILGEEARLRAAFGEAFDRYAAGTRRWL